MKNTIVVLVAVVLAGVAGFYGGMKYQQTQSRNLFMTRSGAGGMLYGQGRGIGEGTTLRQEGSFRPVAGEVLEKDGDSLTLKLNAGGSKIVLLSAKTEINKTSKGQLSDLEKGERIVVFGTENSDGSLSAQNIQLNAQMRFNVK